MTRKCSVQRRLRVTITTILRNNAIETRPGNKIHHLREKRSACVTLCPRLEKSEKLPQNPRAAFKSTPNKNSANLLCSKHNSRYATPLTGQQCPETLKQLIEDLKENRVSEVHVQIKWVAGLVQDKYAPVFAPATWGLFKIADSVEPLRGHVSSVNWSLCGITVTGYALHNSILVGFEPIARAPLTSPAPPAPPHARAGRPPRRWRRPAPPRRRSNW